MSMLDRVASWLLLAPVVTGCATGNEAAPPLRTPADPLVRRAVGEVQVAPLREALTALVGFGTRHTRSETESAERGIGAARRWLVARMREISSEHGGLLQVEAVSHTAPRGPRMPEETEIVNVVATLPGTDPGRVIVVSGHYDSRNSSDADADGDAPGANDDGSGTVAVLEAARAVTRTLSEAGVRPRASIRFACVAGEEQGLYGSRAMAAADREAGLDVVAMITNDIVGGVGGGNGRSNRGLLRLFSEGVPSSELAPPVTGSDADAVSRQLARYLHEAAATFVPAMRIEMVFRQDRYLRGGDHRAYNEQGYAAVRFTDMYEHYDRQHQDVRRAGEREYGDTIEHIDWDNLADVTRINVAGVLSLALAPPSPTGVTVDTRELSHDTRLFWDDPQDADVSGWRIRMRATHAPFWERVIDVRRAQQAPPAADGTPRREHTLSGISKDDVLFAVEAYDATGRASLPVYPAPGR
jgi:Zn-dependent M28 family amino/carboxypeptidase